jgi:hypothetical protein
VTVSPYGEGRLEMRPLDDLAAVKGGVDGAEAKDLGFAAAGGCPADTGPVEGELRYCSAHSWLAAWSRRKSLSGSAVAQATARRSSLEATAS